MTDLMKKRDEVKRAIIAAEAIWIEAVHDPDYVAKVIDMSPR